MRSFLLLLIVIAVTVTGTIALSKSQNLSGPHFNDIILTTSDTHLLLFGELKNSLNKEMLDGLHNGIPIHFTFTVILEQKEKNWLNDELIDFSFSHILSYNTLKQTYVVETEENSKKKFSSSSLQESLDYLNEINGLKIIELDRIRPEKTYRLKIKADLFKKTLPFNLHNVVPFLSWLDLKTDWYTVEFIY